MEVQTDSVTPGMKILVVDDLLATGGSLEASCHLIEKCQGDVIGCLVIIEIESLHGRSRLHVPIHSIVKY